MALYMCIFMGGTPLGAPILGWIAEQWGARWTLVGGGALTIVGTIVSTMWLANRQGVDLFTRSGRGSLRPALSAYTSSAVREPCTRTSDSRYALSWCRSESGPL